MFTKLVQVQGTSCSKGMVIYKDMVILKITQAKVHPTAEHSLILEESSCTERDTVEGSIWYPLLSQVQALVVQGELHPPALPGEVDLEHPGEWSQWWEPNTGVLSLPNTKFPGVLYNHKIKSVSWHRRQLATCVRQVQWAHIIPAAPLGHSHGNCTAGHHRHLSQ